MLAHLMFFQSQIPARERVPILYGKKLSDKLVMEWFRKHRPDVVVQHEHHRLRLAVRGLTLIEGTWLDGKTLLDYNPDSND